MADERSTNHVAGKDALQVNRRTFEAASAVSTLGLPVAAQPLKNVFCNVASGSNLGIVSYMYDLFRKGLP